MHPIRLILLGAGLVGSPATAAIISFPVHANCHASAAVNRKEYGALTSAQRLSFIDALKCVMTKPSLLPDIPTSVSRYTDFAAVHVNMTTSIHMDGIFLSWHRHFVHLMETELHACGFSPDLGMPYWDYTLYPYLEKSPMFDGSATSLGGNGLYDPNTTVSTLPDGETLPHGSGGGCVTTGPFGNMTVRFGPFQFSEVFAGVPPANWTVSNPRCLTRDLNDWGVAEYLQQEDIDELLAYTTIGDFQYNINAVASTAGLHGGGHFGIGGVMFDFFASPQDPAFWLHHGQLDRIWAKWQDSDAGRRYLWNGTSSIFNANTTAPVYNGTILDFSVLGEPITVEEVANPLAGPYCYQYI
jgi:tyrosinase